MNAKFHDYIPENVLETDGIFVNKSRIIIFEVKDKDSVTDAVNEAVPQLRERAEAVIDITNGKIPLTGVIVLPFNPNPTYDEGSLEFHILGVDDLKPEKFTNWINAEVSNSKQENADDQINAMAKILFFVCLKHWFPTSDAEAIEYESERIALQRHTEYHRCFKTTFNSINFTTFQRNVAKEMRGSNTVLSGGYGTGKTVTTVLAVQKLIEESMRKGTLAKKKKKILFVSGQGFFDTTPSNLHYSPFLENARKWIREAIKKQVGKSIASIKYKIEDYLNSKCYLEEPSILVHLCLLTNEIIGSWERNSLSFKDYDLIILEESTALSIQDMDIVIKCFYDSKQSRDSEDSTFWVTTTLCSKDFKEKYPNFKDFKDLSMRGSGLRSTLEIATLCNAFQSYFSPEHYPSVEMSATDMWEGISVTYHCQFYSTKRFKLVRDTIQDWLVPPQRRKQLLIIECQESEGLFNYLLENKIPVCRYKDYSDSSKYDSILFLQPKYDPIEAIVCGAEWSALMFHFQYSVLYSHKAFSVMNKRVISRSIAKVYLFSNAILDDEEVLALTEIRNGNWERDSYVQSKKRNKQKVNRDSLEQDDVSNNEYGDVEPLALRTKADNEDSLIMSDQPILRASKNDKHAKVNKLLQLIRDYSKEYKTVKTLKIWNDEFRIINASMLIGNRKNECEIYIVEEAESNTCYIFDHCSNSEKDLEVIRTYLKGYNISLPILHAHSTDESVASDENSIRKLKILVGSHFVSVSFKPLLVFGRADGEFDILSSQNIEEMVTRFTEGEFHFKIIKATFEYFQLSLLSAPLQNFMRVQSHLQILVQLQCSFVRNKAIIVCPKIKDSKNIFICHI